MTIDCPPDSRLHRGAAATVVSSEYLRSHFPGADAKELLRRYTGESRGLVIFTSGSREIIFARETGAIGVVQPNQVSVKSTLGAGDCFRAGVIHGVLQEMDDRRVVQFAAATAAAVCRRLPFALDPPGLEEITALAADR